MCEYHLHSHGMLYLCLLLIYGVSLYSCFIVRFSLLVSQFWSRTFHSVTDHLLCIKHCVCALYKAFSHFQLFATPWTVPARLLCPWNFPGKNTGVGCHFLLQRIFPAQGSNLCFLHYRWILYHWATWEAQCSQVFYCYYYLSFSYLYFWICITIKHHFLDCYFLLFFCLWQIKE